MSDNARLDYPPTPQDITEQVIEQEHNQSLRSALGPGCCPMCGRPRRECHGGRACWEYSPEELAALDALGRNNV